MKYKKFWIFNLILEFWTVVLVFGFWNLDFSHATPSTHIWSPSTDIQPYKKTHLTSDFYFPTTKKDSSDNQIHVNQVYGLTFGLLSDKPEENLLGKIFSGLGEVMAEASFDYKKGYGSVLDTYPWYFHFKLGVAEDAYLNGMPAVAFGAYDMGAKHDKTDYNVRYFKAGKTILVKNLSFGRFSAGYFKGNGRLLRNKDGLRDNDGILLAWERTISEITDKLWLCVDYQGSQSSYGALNFGFAWKFTDNVSAIVGYDIYNNRNNTDTVTLQVDIDF